jgi:LAO/AO transport system kinase
MLAGAGDELQGIKRGIMEMADAIAINKADGDNIARANLAMAEYRNALHLFPSNKSGWVPLVKTCSALNHKGIGEVWEMVLQYVELTKDNGFFVKNRLDQSSYWMFETINENLKNHFYHDTQLKSKITEYQEKVIKDEKSSFIAARELLDIYFDNIYKKSLKK